VVFLDQPIAQRVGHFLFVFDDENPHGRDSIGSLTDKLTTMDYLRLQQTLVSTLALEQPPVAIAFREDVPAGVARLEGAQPSSCSFWRLAAAGRTFYTVPDDHHNCPIGSYTHNIPLPPAREPELMQTLSLMSDIGYLRMEEVPGVPRLPRTPAVIVYSPLADAPVEPDVVLIAGKPGRLMLLQEAAARAKHSASPMLGRPTCMAIPAAVAGTAVVSSLGCVGNRVYTGISDDAFYTVVSAGALEAIAGELGTIVAANATLAEFHQGRRSSIAAV
jgi:uncharacterized protein (DUF169 family)